jgi:hypothetical protein
MATTTYFEERLHDMKQPRELDVVIGTSSFYGGVRHMYLKIFDQHLILDDDTGKRFAEAVHEIAIYMGWDKDFAK